MYSAGSYVVYGTNGPCRINEITYLDMPGCDTKRKYYVLEPVASKGSIIYSPVDSQKVAIRAIITKEEAAALLDHINEIEPMRIDNEKFREESYREVMREGSCTQIAGLIRTLRQRRADRLAQGKKFTSVDERFLAEATGKLTCELAIALEQSKEEAEEKLEERLGTVLV